MYVAMRNTGIDPSALDFDKWQVQLRKGSLALAVLATLWQRQRYGLEIIRELERVPIFSVAEGTIYPLLSRLKSAGFVDSEWIESSAGHPRKYFRLTLGGRRYALGLASTWEEFAQGMAHLLVPLQKRAQGKQRAS